MSAQPIPLPKGIYAFSETFRDAQGEVTFPFRGQDYTAEIGVNAFGHLTELADTAGDAPDAPFLGRTFDVPAVLIPAGAHNCPIDRKLLPVKLSRPLALLGEAMGTSPNHPDDVRRPNPARTGPESVLAGSFYWGTVAVTGGEGRLLLDGLTLRDTSVRDARSAGEKLGFEVRNCIFENAYGRDVLEAPPTDGAPRPVLVADCRADGLDDMEQEGRFLSACGGGVTLERVYYAHTKKFFGLADYCRRELSAQPGGTFGLTLRGCVLEDCSFPHGIDVALPPDAAQVCVTAEDCVFSRIAAGGVPAFRVDLPHDGCRLTLRRCTLEGAGEAAVLLCGPGGGVTLEDTRVVGYAAPVAHAGPRRTQAPEKIGEVVWGPDRLDDPHTPCGEEGEEALRWLDLLYAGRTVRFGDMHVHTNSGGTSDGRTPLAEFVRQIRALGLDFAAVVDHRQIRHALLPEWDDDLLLAGTEPGQYVAEPGRPQRSRKMDYTLIFRHPSDFFRLMEAFPEYEYTGGTEGHCKNPNFTPERFRDVIDFVWHLGGVVAHAHPKQLMASDDPLHYYFGDRMPLESVVGSADAYSTVQNVRLWESLLKLGKRVHTRGMSDTHGPAKNCALTSTYTVRRKAAEVLDAVREGDCSAGCVGIQMAVNCARMGSRLPWREGLKLAVRLTDYYRPGMKENTVYCLKVFTDRGLAWASEFDGARPQSLVLPVEKRLYYRVEVTNESDGAYVAVSNPIWLD